MKLYHKDIVALLAHSYPELDSYDDYRVTNEKDGKGPYLSLWLNDLPYPNLKKMELGLASALKLKELTRIRSKRKALYPDIGDQLDAILKQLNYMQLDGQVDLVTDMDQLIGKWLKVKRDYPKSD